jgi:tetratricopeptide (TPR) repeat protein
MVGTAAQLGGTTLDPNDPILQEALKTAASASDTAKAKAMALVRAALAKKAVEVPAPDEADRSAQGGSARSLAPPGKPRPEDALPTAEAVQRFEQAVAKNPYDDDSWNALIQRLRQEGQWREALETEKRQLQKSTRVRQDLEEKARIYGGDSSEVAFVSGAIQIRLARAPRLPAPFHRLTQQLWVALAPEARQTTLTITGPQPKMKMVIGAGASFPVLADWKQSNGLRE